jgi:hypothetical protein
MRIGFALAAVLLVATAPGRAAFAAPAADVVRVAGETSPLGWPFSTFAEGTVDAGGGLVFVASSTAIFERQGAPIVQRMGAGTVLPDGRRIADVGPPALAADGCVFARATFTTGGEAVVRGCGATFAVVIDAGTASPGGGTLRAFDPPVFVAGTSMLAASATLEDGTSVLLRHDGTTLLELARSGLPAPTGGTYATLRLLGVTATGRLGFRAAVSDGPNGFFVVRDDGTRAVAVVGQGSPAGGGFTEVGGGSVHASGRAAFQAKLSTAEGSGIFTVDLGDPLLLMRAVVLATDPLPIAGATIRGFLSSIDPSVNATGTVAFRALIEGATDPARPSGVFTATPLGVISAIATVREDLGTSLGVISRLRDPVLADDGSVLVSAVMAGRGPGLFVARDGALVPLARLGDATTVDTGDSRFRFGPASVGATAEASAFLGQRDAIFQAATDGTVTALAYTGRPSPLGGIIASLGPPVVDGQQSVFFGAEFQDAQFNEALLTVTDGALQVLVAPDRRLLGGGGIRELFPTGVDTLARPASASLGVAFTAALQGAKASEALFLARSARQVKAVVRVGQRAGGDRIASLGSPAVGPRNAMALLAEVGRAARKTAVVATGGGGASVIAVVGEPTRTRAEGKFAELGSPVAARRGAVFRAVLDRPSTEGLFIGRGGRLGLLAGTGDTTTAGSRLRAFDSPLAVGDEIWFLARVSGSVAPAGLYRVGVSRIPRKRDEPLAVEPVLLPGDPAPPDVGGVIVRLDAPRVGPGGVVTAVAGIGGGAAATVILQFAPSLP